MRQDDIYLRISTFMFTSCPLILSLKSYIYFKVHVLTGKDDRPISWWFHGRRWKLVISRLYTIRTILKSISSSHYFDTIHKTLDKINMATPNFDTKSRQWSKKWRNFDFCLGSISILKIFLDRLTFMYIKMTCGKAISISKTRELKL